MENASPLKEQARSLEGSGQDQAALDLYLRVAEEEAAQPDPAVLVRIGNLQLRLGRAAEAASAYARSAELLAEAGLPNGAIAVWRRVLRARPADAEPLLRVAELASAQGFAAESGEALGEFLRRMEEGGRADAARDALRAHARAFPSDAAALRLLGETLAPPPEPPPAESDELEVLGSGWMGDDLPPVGDGDDEDEDEEIALVPTRLDGGREPADEVAPVAGLEPTRLEGLESNAFGAWDPPAAPADGSAEAAGADLPLLGTEPARKVPEGLVRRVEEALRAGDVEGAVEALNRLGAHLASAGEAERAAEVWARALELDPRDEEATRALARLRGS